VYLVMLPKILRPSINAVLQDHQALLQQDDVGRFLRDVDGRVNRDADVRGFQCRAVVDSVAEEADDVPLEMQSALSVDEYTHPQKAASAASDQRHHWIAQGPALRRSQRLSAMPLARSTKTAEPVAVRPNDPAAIQVQADASPGRKQHKPAESVIDARSRLILYSPLVQTKRAATAGIILTYAPSWKPATEHLEASTERDDRDRRTGPLRLAFGRRRARRAGLLRCKVVGSACTLPARPSSPGQFSRTARVFQVPQRE
jgi:hypothetical protein